MSKAKRRGARNGMVKWKQSWLTEEMFMQIVEVMLNYSAERRND